jgi:hypothetical protein
MANPTCVLCQKTCENEWGNNPAPIVSMAYGVCCDTCNVRHVIPTRLNALYPRREEE